MNDIDSRPNDDAADRASSDGQRAWPRNMGQAEKALWTGILVSFVSLMCLVFGYQVGKDLAERDNRADCVAAGRLDCG